MATQLRSPPATPTRDPVGGVLPKEGWRIISHNVWGIGGPLPLTTPQRAAGAIEARCAPAARASHTAQPLVVCVQEAFTTDVSVVAFVLARVALAVEWVIVGLDERLAKAGLRVLTAPLKFYYAVFVHSVVVGPSMSSCPVSLPKYVALVLMMTAGVSLILSLLIGLPIALWLSDGQPCAETLTLFYANCQLFFVFLSAIHRWTPLVPWCAKSLIAEILHSHAQFTVGLDQAVDTKKPAKFIRPTGCNGCRG